MKNIFKIVFSLFVIVSFLSCEDNSKRTRAVQYMADIDMYNSVPFESYSTNPNNADGLSSQHPVEGTVARGHIPYEFEDSEEGYQAAKIDLKSPLKEGEYDKVKAKDLYRIYCASCHGDNGDGNGYLVQREKFLGVPNFKDRDITEGSIYHVIMYGRNMMGSHSPQLLHNERWQIVHYVQNLKKDLTK